MKPERWQRINELYYSALEREATQRALFLEQACGSDEELRREVEALLAAHERAGSFLATPALEVEAEAIATGKAESILGQQIGYYQILSLLGPGGMGEVYLAQDARLGRYDQIVKLWDVAAGQDVLTLKGHAGLISSVVFSPDGKTLASGSLDGTVKLWDVATGQGMLALKETNRAILSLSFSSDGKGLAVGSETLRIWHGATDEEVRARTK